MRTGIHRFARNLLFAAAALIVLLSAKTMNVHAAQSISGYVNASSITDQKVELTGNTTLNMDKTIWIESITGWGHSLTIQGGGELHADCTGPESFAIGVKELHLDNAVVSATNTNGDAICVSTYMTINDSYVYADGSGTGIYAPSGNVTIHNSFLTLVGHTHNGLSAKTSAMISDSVMYVTGVKAGIRVGEGDLTIDGSELEIDAEGNGIYARDGISISNSSVDAQGLIAIYSDSHITLGANEVVMEPEGAYLRDDKTTFITPDGYKAQSILLGIYSGPVHHALAVEPLTPGEGKVYLHGHGGGWTDLIDFGLEEGYYWIEAQPAQNYYFGHWQDKDGIVLSTDNPYQIYLNKDMVIRADFYPVADPYYTITVNGGTADRSTAVEGELVTVSANSPPTGKMFSYWLIYGPYIGIDDTTQETVTFHMPAGDVDFNAYFVDKICSYSYDANGGSGSMAGASGVTFGTVITLPKCEFAPPAGKTFDHWQVFGMSYVPGDYLTIDDDVPIRAVWKDAAPSTPPSPPSPPPHEHNYVWQTMTEATPNSDGSMVYICTTCGHISQTQIISSFGAFLDDARNRILNAPANGTVIVNTDIYMSFSKKVIEAMASRPDVNVVIQFKSAGKKYQVSIPAGYPNVMGLLNSDGFAGFLYLGGIFGITPL